MTQTAAIASGNLSDTEYPAYLARIQARFEKVLAWRGEDGEPAPLFTTGCDYLFDVFLANLPEEQIAYHTCSACRHFINRYGGLVTITEDGDVESAIWNEDDAPELYRRSVSAVLRTIRKNVVDGVFVSKETVYGQPQTGPWHHFAVRPSANIVWRGKLRTAGEVRAEKYQDFLLMIRTVGEWRKATVETALKILESEALYRSEKVMGPIKWLDALMKQIDPAKGNTARNFIWRAVATAPAGFCHVKTGMAGTLLDDIEAGMGFEDASRRFAAKMHPLRYQRPQAAPSAGNIAQGEKIIAALGAERSLVRRFARLDELQAFWKPTPVEPKPGKGGVFGHLKTKDAEPEVRAAEGLPAKMITWEKFQRTVLPTARQIELYVPSKMNHFGAFLTAVYPDAPPILQWDKEDLRNPVSWYLYHGGSSPGHWGLKSNTWTPVSAISLMPSCWNGGENEAHSKSLMLVLQDARESRNSGLALFPEFLKPELREIRSTIEAYSKAGAPEGMEEGNACGLILGGAKWDAIVRVTDAAGYKLTCQLDRWD
jgi:hypothetical protein